MILSFPLFFYRLCFLHLRRLFYQAQPQHGQGPRGLVSLHAKDTLNQSAIDTINFYRVGVGASLISSSGMKSARCFASLLLLSAIIACTSGYTANNQLPKNFGQSRVGLLPLMSPENSLYELQRLLDSAQRTLLIENQYIQKFDDKKNWLEGTRTRNR
jgi:hypothetical protein